MKTGLIIALDVKNHETACRIIDDLSHLDVMFKLGSILYTLEGNKTIDYIHKKGRGVFLDLKFFDIPNTVREVSFAASSLGVEMFTIHLLGGREMISASIRGVEEAFSSGISKARPVILGVTVLTSMDDSVLRQDLNILSTVSETVMRLAGLGFETGLRGFVCSPLEIEMMRSTLGKDAILVTPGIRLYCHGQIYS
jgi:orotidine-5'-phosphate decarboxylase